MNRDQKAVAIAEIAESIDQSEAIFAVDYRGITVEQIAELRGKLREADASFKVVKNSLTERAADQVGAEPLKGYLTGPTALTFVRGDVALAAKAVAEYAKATQLLPFKGGLMDGEELAVEQIGVALETALARSALRPARRHRRLARGGLVRTLNALLSGVAIALGQVQQKKESGEIPAGEAPAPEAAAPAAEEGEDAADAAPAAEETEAAAPEAEETEAAAPEAEETEAAAAPEAEAEAPAEAEAEAPAEEAKAEAEAPAEEAAPEGQAEAPEADAEGQKAEPAAEAPAQEDDKQADVSAEAEGDDAETNPTKED